MYSARRRKSRVFPTIRDGKQAKRVASIGLLLVDQLGTTNSTTPPVPGDTTLLVLPLLPPADPELRDAKRS